MKIVQVSTHRVQVGEGQTHVRLPGGWVFVRLRTDDGLTGWGEASHSGDDALLRRAVDGLAPGLIGRSPFDIEALVQPAALAQRGRLQAGAASGVEQALWDLVGKALGQPLHNLLGGRVRDSIRLYANVNRAARDRDPLAYAGVALAARGEGFDAVKCAPFDDVRAPSIDPAALARGLARVRAVRAAIGSEPELLVDCHHRFDRPTALRVADELAPERLYWLEEPLPSDAPEPLAALRARLGLRLAGGEGLIGRVGFRDLVERRALDVAMFDVMWCGGVLEAKKIAAMAEAYDLAVSPHAAAGPVASAAAAQLAVTLPNCPIQEYAYGEVPWRSELVGGEPIQDGRYRPDGRPGIGVEVDERVLARLTATQT
jgi:galactonate dehydratase